MPKPLLSEADLERIRHAVAEAESKTSGEIVPYVVRQCSKYEGALWRAGGTGALAVFAGLTLLPYLYTGWGNTWWRNVDLQTLAIVAAGGALAALAMMIPALKRKFVGRQQLAEVVHRRAMTAFVEKEVFSTRERTGILLFVSLFEHRIEVVGDTGINAKVTPEDWVSVVRMIREGIKAGKLGDGLVKGIHQCGNLLQRSGVEIRPDDVNELPDDVIFEE